MIKKILSFLGSKGSKRQAIVKAHPVQGLLCAHGYKDAEQKTLPVESIFVALKAYHTRVTFTFSGTKPSTPIIKMENKNVSKDAYERITGFVDRIFKKLKVNGSYSIDIGQNFPLAVGIGSSASIFAALAKCIVSISKKQLKDKEISALARLGSHSAAASILGNISYMKDGEFAELLCKRESFPFKILILPVEGKKRSEEVHEDMPHTPFYSKWLECAKDTSSKLINRIKEGRFAEIGPIAERYIHYNFAAISTGPRNILTWYPETFRRIILLRKLRSELNSNFFISTNSGPAVFAYTRPGEDDILIKKLGDTGIECVVTDVGGPVSLLS